MPLRLFLHYLGLPTIFGKSLCGPDFSFRLEDYGYTLKPAVVPLNITNDTITSRTPFNTTISPITETTTTIPYLNSSDYQGKIIFLIRSKCLFFYFF